jgi:hypothetical protein
MLAPLEEGEMKFMKSGAEGAVASDLMTLDDVRRHFGLLPSISRVVLVEDAGAKTFIEEVVNLVRPSVLAKVQIVSGSGESWITSARCHTPLEIQGLRCVGVYDGDMRGNREAQSRGGWPALFLPGSHALDYLTKQHLQRDAKAAAELLEVSVATMELAVVENEGVDHHDWTRRVSNAIGLRQGHIYRKLVAHWLNEPGFREQAEELVAGLEDAWVK